MIQPRRIQPSDDLREFHCGHDSLDDWFRSHALRAERERTATTYVILDQELVVAYYSLAAHGVERATIGGGRLARNSPDAVPCVLLARLAVDVRWQGKHLGSSLLAHGVRVARSAAGMIGLRTIVVGPIDPAAATFYSRYGFRPFPARSDRMFYPL
ncbi:MAG: GNAT family N-acetyltransferase [Micrococcales bacterium]|nr:GNAT family N-acetyltransferase [Micrococcales bacterium]